MVIYPSIHQNGLTGQYLHWIKKFYKNLGGVLLTPLFKTRGQGLVCLLSLYMQAIKSKARDFKVSDRVWDKKTVEFLDIKVVHSNH